VIKQDITNVVLKSYTKVYGMTRGVSARKLGRAIFQLWNLSCNLNFFRSQADILPMCAL